MIQKVLVANRGEIALRVLRALNELGLAGVAVYSQADQDCLHLSAAAERVLIGPPPSAKSYLNAPAILDAARETGADAIHPGYGYLAENAAFAKGCQEAGLVFIGPSPEALALAGDKAAAKRAVAEAGVPVIPSSPGPVNDLDQARSAAAEIGYPVMLKAAAGGGGRGIRICRDESELTEEFMIARSEARAAFGDDGVYLEKYLVSPRHIEFQVLADDQGQTIHLGERECTIQRRYQKLIEEAPSPHLTPDLRKTMGEAAVAAARAMNYRNAGTVEFLVDPSGKFYFIELNARIQVEHPVTELITGVDLVKEQVRLADGGRLEYGFDDLEPRGWAIECRINAEDPDRFFAPSPGTVELYRPPGGRGVRLDTHLYQGYDLPIFYDSLLAKLIAFDQTRDGAMAVMRRALDEFGIGPLKTTIPLHRRVMDDPDFAAGEFTTDFIKRFVPDDDGDEDDD
jgi:acetyl-CoA carboxylase biotin carboxylase subunit